MRQSIGDVIHSETDATIYDYVVVGAGTAGCVLASRLSEDPDQKILLLEAGADLLPGHEPKSIRATFPSSLGDADLVWQNLIAEVGADPGDGSPRFSRPFLQGRGVGGSSNIMGMMAQRGSPWDFDNWQELGAEGWGWANVLPFFNRLENDADFSGSLHGNSGPIPIRRYQRADLPPFAAAIAEVMERDGYEYHPDMNAYFGDGITSVPTNNTAEHRVSAAMGYLTESVRARPNLTIMTGLTAERLLLENRKAVGVILTGVGGQTIYRGKEILVSAGAIYSPALLLRSGIGPADELWAANILAIVDRPGVGKNLLNHAIVHLAVHLPLAAKQSRNLTSSAYTALRYSSDHENCPAVDMQIFGANRSAWHALGRRIGAIGVCLYKPFSTGSVTVSDSTARSTPIVKFNLLSDGRDFDRLVDGLQKAAGYLTEVQAQGLANEAFLPPGGWVGALSRLGIRNAMRSFMINLLVSIPGLRGRLLRKNSVDLAILATNRDHCVHIIRKMASPVHHVSGTCKMGRPTDPLAVVDPNCRVFGVDGLRVVDASIMPMVVSANTHLTVLMIGEKVAQLIKDERRR